MKFTPIAVCLTRASPGPGTGSGTSTKRSTSGPPSSLTTIALGMARTIVARRRNGNRVLRRSGDAEQRAQPPRQAVALARAARRHEHGVVTGDRAEHVVQVGFVEGAGHGRRGAGLGADDD